MSAKPRRFVPRLQVCDDRIVPAITVAQFDTVVVIEGDTAPDQFAIIDNGQADVSVKNASGQTVFQASGTVTTSWSTPTAGTTRSITG
jgi:hypothetical protein